MIILIILVFSEEIVSIKKASSNLKNKNTNNPHNNINKKLILSTEEASSKQINENKSKSNLPILKIKIIIFNS